MTTLITDPQISGSFIAERQRRGIDGHDEVWEGVYFVSPLADNEHQELVHKFNCVIGSVFHDNESVYVYPGINLASDANDWKRDFRVPHIAVFREGTSAVNHRTFWTGGAELAIEIVSYYDKSREKIAFYEKVGTKELLMVDRDPWQLELLRLTDGKLVSTGVATVENEDSLTSETVPFSWLLKAGKDRPKIIAIHRETCEENEL